ncbi:MAG: cation-translocating P-type ATPase, partial [Planctomycetota bacterium]
MSAATEEKAELVFELEGMTCASCVASVRKAIEAVPGVEEVEVSLPLHLARVRAPRPAEADIAAAVARAGYVARPRAPREEGKPLAEEAASAARALADVRAARRRFLVSLVFTLPLLGLAWSSLAGLRLPPWTAWAQGLLATGALAGGTSIFAAAARRARRLGASMDTLVALGTLAAWGASWHALGNGGPLHFAAAGMIVTLVLLGRYLEARAQDRTGAALRGLLDLVPRIAHRLREDGGSEDVPVGELRPGDRLRVLPGEAIPVDGTVLVGSSEVDEALVTGESVPVLRGPGDPVVGGTINGRSPLVVRAVAVGADTQLARIVRLVARAQGSKAEVERLADRVSAVFVPTILLIALATGLGG